MPLSNPVTRSCFVNTVLKKWRPVLVSWCLRSCRSGGGVAQHTVRRGVGLSATPLASSGFYFLPVSVLTPTFRMIFGSLSGDDLSPPPLHNSAGWGTGPLPGNDRWLLAYRPCCCTSVAVLSCSALVSHSSSRPPSCALSRGASFSNTVTPRLLRAVAVHIRISRCLSALMRFLGFLPRIPGWGGALLLKERTASLPPPSAFTVIGWQPQSQLLGWSPQNPMPGW